MNCTAFSRTIGGLLLLAVAAVLGLGSMALWDGRPSDWPDLVAGDSAVIFTSRWALAVAVALIVCAVGSMMNARWSFPAATAALILLVGILFWGHYVLFGHFSPSRMISNVVVAGVVIALLWKGRVT